MPELEEKEARVRRLLAAKGLDALLLRRTSSFAWATGGASSYINLATDFGEAALLYTPSSRYLVANNIEAPRLLGEEGMETQGWELGTAEWHTSSQGVPAEVIGGLTDGMRLGADSPYAGAEDLTDEVAELRAALMPEEGERFRELGRLCGEAMDAAIRRVRPGQTEYEIAALLAAEAYARGATPIVDLVATDERISQYRHPLPTAKRLERYAMLVLCGRMHGLVCSITRFAHFGPLPEQIRRKQEATARVDAAYIAATRPGTPIREVFARAVEAYAEQGYPDEWRLHHQGGAAGYEGREFFATPSATQVATEGQAYAWNPSITGTKSEDTILVGPRTNEVLTEISGWPMLSVQVDGQELRRPAILER